MARQFLQIALEQVQALVQAGLLMLRNASANPRADEVLHISENYPRGRQFLADHPLFIRTPTYYVRKHLSQSLIMLSGGLPAIIIVEGFDSLYEADGPL